MEAPLRAAENTTLVLLRARGYVTDVRLSYASKCALLLTSVAWLLALTLATAFFRGKTRSPSSAALPCLVIGANSVARRQISNRCTEI